MTEIKVVSQDGATKKELRGKRTSSLTSLKESLQKRLKKQPSDVEMEVTKEETPMEETPKEKGTKNKVKTKKKTTKEESAKENERYVDE